MLPRPLPTFSETMAELEALNRERSLRRTRDLARFRSLASRAEEAVPVDQLPSTDTLIRAPERMDDRPAPLDLRALRAALRRRDTR